MTAIPSAPTSLRVTSILRDAVTLAWEAPESDGGEGLTGYVIERKDTTRGGWTTVGSVNAYTRSFKVGPHCYAAGREGAGTVVMVNTALPIWSIQSIHFNDCTIHVQDTAAIYIYESVWRGVSSVMC